MPVVQSIDGVFSLYRDRQGPQRYPSGQRPETAGSQPGEPATSPGSVLTAPPQRAGSVGRTRRPVVVARDVMSIPVLTLPASAPLVQAWVAMRSRQFRHLPIVSDSGTIVGMISDLELLHTTQGTEGRVLPPFPLVRDVMTREIITATPETPVKEIIEVMLQEHIEAVPILNDRHHPVGIFTTTDVLRALLDRAPLELWT